MVLLKFNILFLNIFMVLLGIFPNSGFSGLNNIYIYIYIGKDRKMNYLRKPDKRTRRLRRFFNREQSSMLSYKIKKGGKTMNISESVKHEKI